MTLGHLGGCFRLSALWLFPSPSWSQWWPTFSPSLTVGGNSPTWAVGNAFLKRPSHPPPTLCWTHPPPNLGVLVFMAGRFEHGFKYITFIFPREISNLSFCFNDRIKVLYQPCKERGSGLGGVTVRVPGAPGPCSGVQPRSCSWHLREKMMPDFSLVKWSLEHLPCVSLGSVLKIWRLYLLLCF